jgi:carboxymethylenebutenolidase
VPDTAYAASSAPELGAYLATPRGAGPWPGVIVVMDALGLSDDIKEQADLLAAAGYLAFAPDLYSGRGVRCVLATLKASRTGTGPAYGDIEAARDVLAAREDCTGRIGVIGFCMGGGFAVMLSARRYQFAASSVNYGEVPKDVADRLAGGCPVVGSFGGRDVTLKGRADRLERALTRRRAQLLEPDQRGAGAGDGREAHRLQLPPRVGRGRVAADLDVLRRARPRRPRCRAMSLTSRVSAWSHTDERVTH